MKTNAIVIASIMFAATCAANQAQTANSSADPNCVPLTKTAMVPPPDPSLVVQYDPVSGGYGSSVSGSASSSYRANRNMNLSVGNYHADSSVRGGSNEARGFTRGNLQREGISHPMDPSMQADSSMRGGSSMARGRERNDLYEPYSGSQDGDRIKADSSIRGGSNGPGYSDRALNHSKSYKSTSEYQPMPTEDSPDWYIIEVMPDSDMTDKDTHFQYLDHGAQSKPDSWASDKGASGSIQGSANWNPGDDLLPDGTEHSDFSNYNNDASVGGAATSESGKASSLQLDDLNVPSPDSPSLLSSPGSQKDLNSSDKFDSSLVTPQAESSSSVRTSISGESSGNKAIDQSLSSSSVGGPGSTETGAASSSEESKYNQSSVTVEFGSANLPDSSIRTDTDLAERVKGTLTREARGTFGMIRPEIARNIQVTSHGGLVILKGTVPSQKDKDMIEIRAREITGVHKVDNQLTVSAKADSALRDLNLGRDLEDTTDQLHDLSHVQD